MNFYELTVPTLLSYLSRLENLLEKGKHEELVSLDLRLQPDMLPFSQQVNCTAGFALRTCFPMMKKATPDVYYQADSLACLKDNVRRSIDTLTALHPDQFIITEQETIVFEAGEAHINLRPRQYIQEFSLPNFFFHFSMAYAILRTNGVKVGKSDFDGLTVYAPDFHF